MQLKPPITSHATTAVQRDLASCAPRRVTTNAVRRSALSAAAGLALAAMAPAGMAEPAMAHWNITDLGTLGGTLTSVAGINATGQVTGASRLPGLFVTTRGFLYSAGSMTSLGAMGGIDGTGINSTGYGINDNGQVVGSSDLADRQTYHAFLYADGAMTDLGTLGGSYSTAYGINANGQVTGNAYTAGNAAGHAFLYSNGKMTDLGTFGGTTSTGYGINAAGQVTGNAYTDGNAANRAFIYSNGSMTDLGTLGGSSSGGRAINAAGQVTGSAFTAGNAARHAFLYSNGSMTDLNTLGGTTSVGNAINALGQVTGYSTTAGNTASHAFLYSNGSMTDLNALNGVAGSSVTLYDSGGINDSGQIVANGTNNRGYLLTLDTTVWQGGSSGSFASSSGWSYLTAPNKNTAVVIDPTISTAVTGPSGSTTVRQLTIGGDGSGNNGIAALALNGGTLNVTDTGLFATHITAKGVLTGDGTLTGRVTNEGTVSAVNLSLPGGLFNLGTVMGRGVLTTDLSNSGLLRVDAGQLLRVNGSIQNAGSTELRGGGELHVSGRFTNEDGGNAQVVLDNGIIRFNGGLQNDGLLLVTFGGGSVFGGGTTSEYGRIILSGNSNTTFYGAMDVQRGGELRVSAGSAAVFFGQVFQRTGALFTGSGTKFYEGGLTIGGSPGLALDGGDVDFGAGNVFIVDIGGTTACVADCATNEALRNRSFDKYIVAGKLGLGGTLKLGSWNGFTLQAGQRFDLLDWGSVVGRFDSIDTSGLLLAAGTALDTSQLALDGSFSVVAVPEPGSWALMLAGLAGVAGRSGWTRRRRDA